MNLLKVKCNYKDSLQVCRGDGKVQDQIVVDYGHEHYDILYLCTACADYVCQDGARLGYSVHRYKMEKHEAKEN